MPKAANRAYLAFDLGAESGRAVLGRLQSGVLSINEIHRFANEPVEYSGSLHWDIPRLWLEMRRALLRLDKTELSGIGVDTWGVDYALVGERGELLQNPYHYRDQRTRGVMEEVFRKIPKEEIYNLTGIQFMPINTLNQLFAAQRDTPELLKAAKRLLTIPDLFHFWLTGNAVCEFTIATTTQLVSPFTRAWLTGLMERLDLPSGLPAPIVEPGTVIGQLLPEIGGAGFENTPVIAPASHDTASAVASVAASDGTAFISSGTWSLVGTELHAPIVTPEALRCNFTNEGGVAGTTRFLKNVMGLWMLQRCRQCWTEQGHGHHYEDLIKLAVDEPAFAHLVDPDEESFLRARDMPEAIDHFCKLTQQPVPPSPSAYARAILESLALKYRVVVCDLERVTRKSIEQIRVIGGGSKNRLLNQFTADATGKTVVAGPMEAAALGNLAVQILATGEASSLQEARAIVERSFATEIFEPRETDRWDAQMERFRHYTEITYA